MQEGEWKVGGWGVGRGESLASQDRKIKLGMDPSTSDYFFGRCPRRQFQVLGVGVVTLRHHKIHGRERLVLLYLLAVFAVRAICMQQGG